MRRRDFLKLVGLGAGTAMFKLPRLFAEPASLWSDSSGGIHCGWKYDPKARQKFIETHRYPFLSQQDSQIAETGAGQASNWAAMYEEVTKRPHVAHDQGIGDCVSHGFGTAVDFLCALQVKTKRSEKWMGECATEIIYGGSRIEIGKMTPMQARGDGSTGFWAGQWLAKYGVLLRTTYPGGFDFTTYDPKLAKTFGYKGVPDALEPLAKLHPVKTVALVNSWEECRDAIYNGHFVAMCSNIGFGDTQRSWVRDKEGFLRRKTAPWYHCMFLCDVDDSYRRPGALCVNSWGPHWITGPTRRNMPEGSFWIDADTIDAAMKQGDSMALSNFVGYPRTVVPPYILV